MTTASKPPEYREIPLDDIVVSNQNVRRRERLADVDLLAKNIERIGLQQPIVVRPRNGKFEVLVGQRRLEAFRFLGKESIPAKIVQENLSDLEALALSFSENVHRKDLEPGDKADVCVYLVEQLGSVREAARYLGVTETTVRNWIDYAGVPMAIKQMVTEGRLRKGVATRVWFAAKGDEERAKGMAELVASENPPPKVRERLITAFEEDPHRTHTEVRHRAAELQTPLTLEIEFPSGLAVALRTASEMFDLDTHDIVRNATVDWLHARGLVVGR